MWNFFQLMISRQHRPHSKVKLKFVHEPEININTFFFYLRFIWRVLSLKIEITAA